MFGRRLEIRQLTIHGTETPPSPPFLQVPVVRLRFGIDSLLGGQVSLRELQLLDPAAHIEVAADGFTNVPKPAAAEDHQPGPDLFDLAVGLFALDRGSVYWNGTRYDISVSAEDLRVRTQFDSGKGTLRTARIRLRESSAEIGGLEPLLSRGEADVWLYRDRIVVPNVLLEVGNSQLSGDVLLDGWRQPNAVANYEAEVDLPALAAWLDNDVVQSGTANVKGKANWDAAEDNLTYSGAVSVTELSAKVAAGAVGGVAAQAEYSGDQNSLSLTPLRLDIWGSSLSGSARVDNLQNPAAARLRLEGEIQDVALDEVYAALEPSSFPLESLPQSLPWASTLAARIEVEGEPRNLRS